MNTNSKKIVVFGASSAIASATLKFHAENGYECCLVGRDDNKLKVIADDLLVRGAQRCIVINSELSDYSIHADLLKNIHNEFGSYEKVLVAYGTLSDQAQCEMDFDETLQELTINLLSVISLVSRIANQFEAQGAGQIAVISSVAGDRGRQSNYVYGTAKGGLSIFLQGLRNRLHKSNVNVLTVKPGFVD
ncbi:MAG: SDR family NAD(P)-dependent oxidoreductase, partial [Thioalkalispiraceae bacterium]